MTKLETELNRTINMLMAHPDNEPNSEFADRIDSLIDLKEAITVTRCCKTLPTKDEVITEGEKQIIDWLEGNTDREKEHYRIGFRRSFEYVLRRLK